MIEMSVRKRLSTENGWMNLELSMHIEAGTFFTLYGPSGAGKSTILRMLAGLIRPDEGLIIVHGKTWFDSDKKINLSSGQRGVGMVFQDYALFPTMNVRRNLEYALPRKAKQEDHAYIDELLDISGLSSLATRMPDSLSGGQKQRVALARSLVRRPKLLLLDEPLSALDAAMRKKLQDLILQLHRRSQLTTILVSHDMSEVFRTSDRVLLLDHGRVLNDGTPENIFIKKNVSGKFRFSGEVLSIHQEDVLYIVSVLIGHSVVRVVAMQEEISYIQVGDTVVLASKSMNPLILKMQSKTDLQEITDSVES